MEDIDVPTYFLCPISLDMMKDPVAVATGITYDRESIEKWIFSGKNEVCPVTKQVLTNFDLTPNHTLRRFIQSWCTLNASHGIQRLPTPKPPINESQIQKLLLEAKSPKMQVNCFKSLRSIASANETNKRCIEASGAVDFLVSILNENYVNHDQHEQFGFEKGSSDEALSTLYHLQLSEPVLKSLITKNGKFFDTLISILQYGSFESRAYAIFLLNDIIDVSEPMYLASLSQQFFVEIVQILKDSISSKATKAALQTLINTISSGRNKIKAVEAGSVSLLVDLLVDTYERRACEMILMVLDLLCQCAEGRAEFLKHGAGLAVVSKKILRVSKTASEKGVKILVSVSRFSATPGVVQEMLQLGVVAKLCLVLQVDSRTKTKERAREVLKLHAKAWKGSSCIPIKSLSSFQ